MSDADDKPVLVRAARPAMGCLFEAYAGGRDADALERAAHDALDRVGWIEAQLSHFAPDSDLSRLNARAAQAPVAVGPALWALLIRLRALSALTGGAFDPTCGKLVRAWGFFRRGALRGEPAPAPDPGELDTLAQGAGWRNVELDDRRRTVFFRTPAVELHLGAFGKGYAAQAALDLLREAGAACALVSGGQSSVAAFGTTPGADGWPVGLPENPGAGGALGSILLRDASLSTSGTAEQAVTAAGRRVSHLLDPRTGRPAEAFAALSALAPDAGDGDALATAFFVQGADWTRRFCASRPDVGAYLFPDGGAAPEAVGEAARRALRPPVAP